MGASHKAIAELVEEAVLSILETVAAEGKNYLSDFDREIKRIQGGAV